MSILEEVNSTYLVDLEAKRWKHYHAGKFLLRIYGTPSHIKLFMFWWLFFACLFNISQYEAIKSWLIRSDEYTELRRYKLNFLHFKMNYMLLKFVQMSSLFKDIILNYKFAKHFC